jgi:hypothetical protein
MADAPSSTKERPMTSQQIQEQAARAMVKYEVARQIRELLDAAREKYGASDWDSDDLEYETLELVRD